MPISLPFAGAFALSGLIGLSLGLLGGGGSILAVPVLVYVARWPPAEAIPASLAIVGATSLWAGVAHWRAGNVRPSAAGLFAVVGAVGASLGARLTPLVDPRHLLLGFAGLMIVVGAAMLRQPGRGAKGEGSAAALALAALVVGVLTGFLGVGGGFLLVPALNLLGRLPIRTSIGTSLIVIFTNSAAGLATHLGQSHLAMVPILAFTAAAIIGAVLGQRLGRAVSLGRLRSLFAVMVIAVGIAVGLANL